MIGDRRDRRRLPTRSVLRSLDHGRQLVRLHQRLATDRSVLPRPKDELQAAIADCVADLWHLASRCGILWSEVEKQVRIGLEADWEE